MSSSKKNGTLGLGEASGGILPVGHIPELVDVVGTDVLVLQVVSVLPNIDTNNWNQTGSGLSKFKSDWLISFSPEVGPDWHKWRSGGAGPPC